jgi:hypothetical protein
MSQDHTCYNMSVTNVKVRGIANIDKTANIYCPTSGNRLGELLLWQTLMRYLKLHDGSPLCAEIHQQGLLGQVNMVIPNTSDAEARFEMLNKQPARYLYHVLPIFRVLLTFIQEILCQSMDPAVAMEAPLCTWDNETGILTTPQDNQINGILSDVCSLPFFQDVLAVTPVAEVSKSGRKKNIQLPKCASSWAAIAASKLSMEEMTGSTLKLPSQALSRALVPRPPQPHLQQPISWLLSLTKPTVPPPKTRVMETAVMNLPPGHHSRQLLVMKMGKLANRPAVDSPLCPPPATIRGAAITQASSGECEVAGSIQCQQN